MDILISVSNARSKGIAFSGTVVLYKAAKLGGDGSRLAAPSSRRGLARHLDAVVVALFSLVVYPQLCDKLADQSVINGGSSVCAWPATYCMCCRLSAAPGRHYSPAPPRRPRRARLPAQRPGLSGRGTSCPGSPAGSGAGRRRGCARRLGYVSPQLERRWPSSERAIGVQTLEGYSRGAEEVSVCYESHGCCCPRIDEKGCRGSFAGL